MGPSDPSPHGSIAVRRARGRECERDVVGRAVAVDAVGGGGHGRGTLRARVARRVDPHAGLRRRGAARRDGLPAHGQGGPFRGPPLGRGEDQDRRPAARAHRARLAAGGAEVGDDGARSDVDLGGGLEEQPVQRRGQHPARRCADGHVDRGPDDRVGDERRHGHRHRDAADGARGHVAEPVDGDGGAAGDGDGGRDDGGPRRDAVRKGVRRGHARDGAGDVLGGCAPNAAAGLLADDAGGGGGRNLLPGAGGPAAEQAPRACWW